MADVICCQQKSAGGIRVFTSNHANTCDAAKQHFHQQLAGLVKCRFHFLECFAAFRAIEKLFFPADSFF